VRGRVQQVILDVLDEEVAGLLGCGKSQRFRPVDASPGYQNGSGKPRQLTLSGGLRRELLRGRCGAESGHV
jgi:hypothetical protein